ncbi:HEPN domain-containing protein [Pseudomonas sp. GNP014]
MKRHASLKNALDAAFARADKIDIMETELRADFARHLCVLVSGFLDQTIKNFTTEYVKKRASPQITHYVSGSIKNLTNLKSTKLSTHLLSFDESWRVDIEKLISDERKEAIDSLVTLRHGIAHGQPGDVSLARVKGYYNEIVKVIQGIKAIMDIDNGV